MGEPNAVALLPFPERSVHAVNMVLSAGSAPFPVTQSALSQSVKEEIPSNAFVFGHGLDAVTAIGLIMAILRNRAVKTNDARLRLCPNTRKL